MNKRLVIAAVTLLSSLCSMVAIACGDDGHDGKDLPRVMKSALEVYKAEGGEKFIITLLKGSAIENDRQTLAQVSLLEKIEEYYGDYQDYEVLNTVPISSRTTINYYVMHYSKGPVYGNSLFYKVGDNEIVVNFNFHTEPQKVLPPCYISEGVTGRGDR